MPGQSRQDLNANLGFWAAPTLTQTHQVADYDGDRRITVLDFVRQTSCLQLGPGLVGSYFGFAEGAVQPNLTLRDTDQPGFSPAAVHVTPRLDDDGSDAVFLNSDMRQAFRAEFRGFLQVPEDAEYRLQLLRGHGARLSLDHQTLIEYAAAPFIGEVVLNLDAGLYELAVDTVHHTGNPEIIFAWASTGSVIGPHLVTVDPTYLWHNRTTPPPHANTALSVHFSQPNFSRVTQSPRPLTISLLSPETNYRFELNGRDIPVNDGVIHHNLDLEPGLNRIPWRAVTGENRQVAGELVLQYDDNQPGNPGLATLFYNNGPGIHAHTIGTAATPVISTISTTAEIGRFRDGGRLQLDGRLIGRDLTTWKRGRIWIETAGTYFFRLFSNKAAQLRIHGQPLITQAERDRINRPIFLERGYHQLEIANTEFFHSPFHEFTWRGPGFDWQNVPERLLSHLDHDRIAVPDFTHNQGHPGRVGGDLIAEYLFEKERLFADSGEHGYDLWADTRVMPREQGGFTSSGPFEIGSTAAGSHFGEAVKASGAFTFEFDFVFRPAPIPTRRIIMLEWRSVVHDPFLHFFLVGNQLRFRYFNGEHHLARLNTNTRYHFVVTHDETAMRVYLNGSELPEFRAPGGPVPNRFHNTQTLRFREMFGTTNVLALYSRALSPEEVAVNDQANRVLRQNDSASPAYWTVGEPFDPVPPGTKDAEVAEALHVLHRAAFGPSPESLKTILTMGIDAWLEAQLNPETVPQSPLVEQDQTFFDADANSNNLRARMLLRMVHSERQLEEVMTWFWENHFNTDLTKTASVREERRENDRFRALALGRFEDLLLASALNVPMTRYLDSATNVVGAPNENYAREILELHSHGEDNGYVYEDIVAAARCFTGWRERDGRFYFNPGRHDFGEKHLLGITLAGNEGLGQGLALIRHLARSPHTAEFISTKLCQFFVADTPPAEIVSACMETYLEADGSIREVLRTLFHHPQFRNDPRFRRNKIKTPLEFWVSGQRALGARDHQGTSQSGFNLLGMNLFHFMEPTGFSERNDAWVDTNAVFYRWQIVNDLTTNQTNAGTPSLNIDVLRRNYGLHTAYEALRFMELMFAHGQSHPTVRRITEEWLTNGSMQDVRLDDNHRVHNRLPQTINLYMRLPAFNVQ
ncbi:DUF1800 family protein [Acanthopleuribacter pedis]|uniref:DUF1800 family protein n=1 Tax=Acanthopleuribacter pedis TaxID=442870 RepID=A0A8J7U274_9BACT|nr:DUF1800 family protein [Acanthopleuribacter pedis]